MMKGVTDGIPGSRSAARLVARPAPRLYRPGTERGVLTMSRNTLKHDCAFTYGMKILNTVHHLLREEEYKDAHKTFYDIVKDAIEWFDTMQTRENQRLLREPSKH
jgi:hypothetical protein